VALLLFASGCKNSSRSDKQGVASDMQNDGASVGSTIKYSEYLKIEGDTIVSINEWEGKKSVSETFVMVPRDSEKILAENKNAIPVPIRSCVCMSTSYLAYLNLLGKADCVKALSGTQFVYNENVKKLISDGKIADIGAETAPNYEKIMSLKPDVIFVYGISGNDNTYIEKLRHLGLRVIPINDYLERTPLAKMEYLKLFGLLTGSAQFADSVFEARAGEYLKIKNECAKALSDKHIKRTRVLLNMPFKGIWYVPGGKNYTSNLIKDAGGDILGTDPEGSSSAQLGFEKIYALAAHADIWLHPNTVSTFAALAADNPLYKNIPAFAKKQVYNNTKRSTPGGGSDFWEDGAVEPQEILKDLIQIMHPEIAQKGRDLKYYIRLK
jgi:iron complex transport system substrate-binding protein